MTAAIEIRGLRAGYGERIAIDDVNLSIARGSLTAIFGPNGGGESTLLKCIAGLMAPRAGTISVLGEPVGAAARRIAYVPQAEQVDWSFPIAVEEVVAMGRTPIIGSLRRPKATDRAAVHAALERVDMLGAADRQIGALSGGQRRRVFIARALASEPKVPSLRPR